MNHTLIEQSDAIEVLIKHDLLNNIDSERKRILVKLFGAALGSIPWVGGFLAAISDHKSDNNQLKNNQLYEQWLEEHSKKMTELANTLYEVSKRLNDFSNEINERLESEEYLQIVRKSFRTWDSVDTTEKKDLIRKLLTNSGVSKLVPDDLIRLFLDWLSLYHEVHFSVIKAIYQHSGITRHQIWQELNGTSVREDSLEADLFKLIIRDLSTGSVIRQSRATDYAGNFIKKSTKSPSRPTSTMKSAFDNQDTYELTELGQHFVHYTMDEVVPRLS